MLRKKGRLVRKPDITLDAFSIYWYSRHLLSVYRCMIAEKISMTNVLRLFCVILLMTLVFPSLLTAQVRNATVPLLSPQELAPLGLQRVWHHQLSHHSPQARILGTLLEGGQLLSRPAIPSCTSSTPRRENGFGPVLWGGGIPS